MLVVAVQSANGRTVLWGPFDSDDHIAEWVAAQDYASSDAVGVFTVLLMTPDLPLDFTAELAENGGPSSA